MSEGLLDGRVVVVTGGARGIGLAVARRCAQDGASVAVADLDEGAAEAAAAQVQAAGPGRALAVGIDVTDLASVEAAAARVTAELGGVDCVVANAGILVLRPVLDLEPQQWRRVLEVNLTGAFLTCKVFGRILVDQGRGGRIVLTSSLFGVRGGVENGAYSASKFGMLGLMESLAAELAPAGVLVNAVCPGQVRTEMMDRLLAERAELTGAPPSAVEREMTARIPLGRMAHVEEVADTFVYLASDLSRYVTGQALVVDGGWQVG